MTNIKDYIYLDETLINSLLAQFKKGLVQSIVKESSSEIDSGEEKINEVNAGLDGFFGFGLKAFRVNSEKEAEYVSKAEKEIINNLLHDYALDMLLEEFKTRHLLFENLVDVSEGMYVRFTSDFTIYDFEYIGLSTSDDALEIVKDSVTEKNKDSIDQMNKKIKEIQNNKRTASAAQKARIDLNLKLLKDELQKKANPFKPFEMTHSFTKLCLGIYPETILIKLDEAMVFCDNKMFRMNKSQLTLLQKSKRKLTILGQVVATQEEITDFESVNKNGFNIEKIPFYMSEVLLSHFGSVK